MNTASDHEPPESESTGCDYCGLPQPGGAAPARESSPAYCCFGCRFAAQVTRERGEEGAARWALTRLGISVFFTMNVVMMSMALWSGDWYEQSSTPLAGAFEDLLRWGSLLCAIPVLLLLGSALAGNAWDQLRRRVFSSDALLLSGVVASFAYSAVSVLRGNGPIYFEVGCVVLVMVTLGRWFEATGRLKASAALDALERLLPDSVRRVENAGETSVALSQVRIGDRLRILAGERFPTDGRLARSWALVDQRILTGESWPVSCQPGDRILGGSLNLDGVAEIEVTAEPSQGTLARLIALVREARRSRGHWQRLADRVSSVLLPAIAVIAIATTVWHASAHGLERGLLAGLAVTLIACPCALGLATPLAVWTALGRAAHEQVLFRSGEAMERLAGIHTVCIDKTGTLTSGDPQLVGLFVEDSTSREDVEREAAAIAAGSTHVLSQVLSRELAGDSSTSRDVRVVAGKGLCATSTEFGEVRLGSAAFLRESGHEFSPALERELASAVAAGRAVALIGWQGRVRGLFPFEESLRPQAAEALDRLRRLGVDVVVLTGDHSGSAARLERELGVLVESGLLPEDKLRRVREVRRHGPVAMVGDGVNDAPSLAASDVGIAMGCGADVSRDSAGICLLGNDLDRIPWAIELARETVRKIRLNLFWAFAWNILGVGLASAGLLNPALAAFAMVASSVLVITNSLSGEATAAPTASPETRPNPDPTVLVPVGK